MLFMVSDVQTRNSYEKENVSLSYLRKLNNQYWYKLDR